MFTCSCLRSFGSFVDDLIKFTFLPTELYSSTFLGSFFYVSKLWIKLPLNCPKSLPPLPTKLLLRIRNLKPPFLPTSIVNDSSLSDFQFPPFINRPYSSEVKFMQCKLRRNFLSLRFQFVRQSICLDFESFSNLLSTFETIVVGRLLKEKFKS